MPAILLKSKLYISPVLPGLVQRRRLFDLLQVSWGCKLTLVVAPAGFGKTTLLSDWISSRILPSAWLSLDQRDNDPMRFLTYLIASLQSIKTEIGVTAMALIESARHSSTRLQVEALFPDLLSEVAEIANPFVMILDDYHVITEPEVHQAISFLISHMPRCMHLVISSRTEPPWPLARLRATRQLTELRINDLRFTMDETASFLNDTMQLNISDAAVSALAESTEGWIAGLQMAALTMRGRNDIQEFISAFAGSHHYIADFLVEEVLNHQPEDIRGFLLKTSILERFCGPLCDAVTGRSNSQAILFRLQQNNLFLVALDDERKWFRYHHLFRDLLRSNLEHALPSELSSLHQEASLWFAEANLHEEAISHAFASKNLELAAHLVEKAAQRLDIENKIVTIAQWITALPEALVLTRPWLCVYLAWGCYWTGQRAQVVRWLLAAEKGLSPDVENVGPEGKLVDRELSETDRRHITGHIAAIRSHYALTNEDIPGVLEYSRIALELLPEGDDARTESAVARGGAYWGLGDLVEGERTFDMARRNAQKGGNPALVVPSTCYVGMLQTKQGRMNEAMASYRNALQYATTPGGLELPAAGFPNIKIGDMFREWNQLDAAGPFLLRGIHQCQQLGQADVLADGFVALARWQLALGELVNAQESIQNARQIQERGKIDPFVQCWLDDCQLRLWLKQRDMDSAVRWAQTYGLTTESDLSYHFDLHHINLARLLLALARQEPAGSFLKDARLLLGRLQSAAENVMWIQEQIKIHILQALSWIIAGESQRGLEGIGVALHLAEPGGYIRLFIDEGSELRSYLETYQKEIISRRPELGAYLTRLLGEFAGNPPAVSQVTEIGSHTKIAEPLTARELDVLRLLSTSMTSNEIGEVLYIAPSTVRTHIKSIYSKLMVNRRLNAIQRAKDLNLI